MQSELCELRNLSTQSDVLLSDGVDLSFSEPIAQSAAPLAVLAEHLLRAVGCYPR